MHAALRTVLGCLVIALVLGGCARADTDEAASAIDVTASEFSFEPNSWTAAADTDVTVDLRNEGTVEHEWAVLRSGTTIDSEEEFEEGLVEFEAEADAGESSTGSFSLPAGTYQVICAVPGHFAAGMQGELTLR